MPNTTGVLDGVTITLERVIVGYELLAGNPVISYPLSLNTGDGLIVLSLHSVNDDVLASMVLTKQSSTYEQTDNFTYALNFYRNITDTNQDVQLSNTASGSVLGNVYIFRVQGCAALGASGSWSGTTSSARTLQAPGSATLVQLVQHAVAIAYTGANSNAWRLLVGNSESSLLATSAAADGTTSFDSSTSGRWFEIKAKEKVRKQRFVTVRDPVVAQPQESIEVDWDNPIVQKYKLVAAVRYAPNGQVLVSERGVHGRGREYRDTVAVTGPVNHAYPTPFGTGWVTNLSEAQFYNGGYYFTLDKRYTVALVGAFYAPNNNNETSNGQYIVLGSNFDFRKDSYSTTVRVQENGGNWSFNNASGGFVYVMGRDASSTSNLARVWVDGKEQSLTVDASPTTTNAAVAGAVGSGVGNRHAGFADVIRYYFAEAPDAWLARELYDNPWQLLKPRERRIHIPAPVVTHKRKRLL
jgi:hypothetical protein